MDKDHKDLLATAKERWVEAKERCASNYRRGEDDQKFVLGDQYSEEIKKIRKGRPCLKENQLLPFAHQVVNDIRQTRPAIKVAPVDDSGDIETARIRQGLIRNIEYQSKADTAYDTGAWNAVTAGVGWIRIGADYCDPYSFEQELRIMRVLNFQSVIFDPNSEEMDGSDAEFAFVYDKISKKKFERGFKGKDAVSFDTDEEGNDEDIVIAEYFYKEWKTETIVEVDVLREQNHPVRGPYIEKTKQSMTLEEAQAQNLVPLRSREAMVPTIKWAKLSGKEVLEETEWPGLYIPIVPVYGLEAYIDGKREFYSLIHQGKDPQVRVNLELSNAIETTALQPRQPFIGPVGAFNTMRAHWNLANSQNYAFLEYDAYDEQGRAIPAPQRQAPTMANQAAIQQMMLATEGIKRALGVYNASLGMESSEKSGKAIIAKERQGDTATFHFVDNLAASIRHVGRIINDLLPIYYSGEKARRILGENDKPEIVQAVDFSIGKYDVSVSVGPSFASQREQQNSFITEVIRAYPQAIEIMGDKWILSSDMPGAEEIAERMKKMFPAMQDENDQAAMQMQKMGEMVQALQGQLAQAEEALKNKQGSEAAKYDLELKKIALEEKKLQIEATKAMADMNKMKQGAAQPQERAAQEAVIEEIMARLTALTEQVQDITEATSDLVTYAESMSPPEIQGPSAPVAPPPEGGFLMPDAQTEETQ